VCRLRIFSHYTFLYIIGKNAFSSTNACFFSFPERSETNGKKRKKINPFSPFPMSSAKEKEAEKALKLKENNAIEAYKRKKEKHRKKCMRKYPRKIIYKTLREALLSNSTTRECKVSWEQERFGYIRSGHVQSRNYVLEEPVEFWHHMTLKQLQNESSSRQHTIVCITELRVISQGTGDTMYSIELIVTYSERGTKRSVPISEFNFLSSHFGKLVERRIRSFVPRCRNVRQQLISSVRSRINQMYHSGSSNAPLDANYDVFFSDSALQVFTDHKLLVVGFDNTDSAIRTGVESASAPFQIVDFGSKYFSLQQKPIWVAPGQLQKRLRFLNKEEGGTGYERFLLDSCSGSCLSALHFLAVDGNVNKVAVCVDVLITYTADEEAWANDNVIFVEGRVEEMDYLRIPPLGLVKHSISAPCCKIHSVARNPFYAQLRKDYGKRLSKRLQHGMIRESLRCVRVIVDCNSYFNAAYYIENPTGNVKVGLFIHGNPFWDLKRDVDYRIFDTSYCMWNSEGPRKHTSIMVGNHSNLQNFELRHKCLLTANPCKYLRETRGTTHKRQVRFNDYAYDKNKVHPKELVQYLANMLTQ